MNWLYWSIGVYALGGVLTSARVAIMPWELSLWERLQVFAMWPVVVYGLAFNR